MPEQSARRLLEVAEAESLLPTNGHFLHPRDTLGLHLSRADSQLVRIALKRKKGEFVDDYGYRKPGETVGGTREARHLDSRFDCTCLET